MRIMIAVPCMDTAPISFVESMMTMQKPEGTSVCFHRNSLIYDSRNLLSLRAMQEKYDYVLWLDSDMICPQDTIPRMLDDLKNNPGVPMVTGLYVKRVFPTSPVIFDVVDPPGKDENGNIVKKLHECTDYPKNSLFPVEGCGFGCVLMDIKLIKEVWCKFGPAFAPFPWAGEDIAFCYRVKKLGYKILCDSNIHLGHIGNFVYTEALLNGGGENEKH